MNPITITLIGGPGDGQQYPIGEYTHGVGHVLNVPLPAPLTDFLTPYPFAPRWKYKARYVVQADGSFQYLNRYRGREVVNNRREIIEYETEELGA